MGISDKVYHLTLPDYISDDDLRLLLHVGLAKSVALGALTSNDETCLRHAETQFPELFDGRSFVGDMYRQILLLKSIEIRVYLDTLFGWDILDITINSDVSIYVRSNNAIHIHR